METQIAFLNRDSEQGYGVTVGDKLASDIFETREEAEAYKKHWDLGQDLKAALQVVVQVWVDHQASALELPREEVLRLVEDFQVSDPAHPWKAEAPGSGRGLILARNQILVLFGAN